MGRPGHNRSLTDHRLLATGCRLDIGHWPLGSGCGRLAVHWILAIGQCMPAAADWLSF